MNVFRCGLRGFAVLVPLLFLLCGCRGWSTHVYVVTADQTILAFGDSLTNGYGAAPGQSYPEQLAELTGWVVIKSGVNGETTQAGVARLPGVLQDMQPDVVLLCLGGNDFLRKLNTQTTRANLQELIGLIVSSGAQPILVAAPEPTLLALSDHAVYAALAREQGVPLISDVMSDTLKKSAWRSDRFHPNAQGYANIAKRIATALGFRDEGL